MWETTCTKLCVHGRIMKLLKPEGCSFSSGGGNVKKWTMIVEVHGIPVWTRVRFPPGPFIVVRRDPSKMGGFLITQADAHERSSYIIASATYVLSWGGAHRRWEESWWPIVVRRKEAIGFFDGIEQAKKWLLDERRDLVWKVFLRFSLIEVLIMIRKLHKDCVKFFV